MKRYLFRAAVFIAAFLISVVLVSGWTDIFGADDRTVGGTGFIESPVQRPILSGEVEIRYRGFIEKEGRLFAQFEVINGTSSPISYSGYEEGTIAAEDVFYNNVEGTRYYICGTGLNTYELPSGASFTDEVYYGRFEDYVNKNGNLQVAYWLKPSGEKEFKLYKSGEFRLPQEIKRRLADEIANNRR